MYSYTREHVTDVIIVPTPLMRVPGLSTTLPLRFAFCVGYSQDWKVAAAEVRRCGSSLPSNLTRVRRLPSGLKCFDTVGGRQESDEVLAWLSVWSKVQMICIWSS